MRLKELREEKKLTQTEVATAIGGTQSNLAKWEKEKIQPAADMVIKLADFFGVSTDYLLERSDELGYVTIQNSPTAPNLSEEDKKLLSAFHGLDRELQELLWDMIRTWQKNAAAFSPQKHA